MERAEKALGRPHLDTGRSFFERVILGAVTLGEVNTPTVIVINTLLSVGVIVLSGTLAVLHVASEVQLGDRSRQEGQGREVAIQTHVLVLLVLTVGLLASFNWFIGAYRDATGGGDDDDDEEEETSIDGSHDNERGRERRHKVGSLVREKSTEKSSSNKAKKKKKKQG